MAKTPPPRNADDLEQRHADGGTHRPEDPALEGRVPLPEELTGRASGTDEDLVALFDNRSDTHLADGFRGGSDDEPPVDGLAFEDDPTQQVP
jgi:hypothetical protein